MIVRQFAPLVLAFCGLLLVLQLLVSVQANSSSSNNILAQPKYELKFQSELNNSTVIKQESKQQIFKCQVRLAPVPASVLGGNAAIASQQRSRLKSTTVPVVPPLLLSPPDTVDQQNVLNINSTKSQTTTASRWPANVALSIDWLKADDLGEWASIGIKEPIVVINVEFKSNSSGLRNDKKSKARIEIKNTLNGNQMKLASRLKLSPLRATDSGQYKCTARASYIQVIGNGANANYSSQEQLLVDQTLESSGANLMVVTDNRTSNTGSERSASTNGGLVAEEGSGRRTLSASGGLTRGRKQSLKRKPPQVSGGTKSNLDLATRQLQQHREEKKPNDTWHATDVPTKGRQAPPPSNIDSRGELAEAVMATTASSDQAVPEEDSGLQLQEPPMNARDSNEYEAAGKRPRFNSGLAGGASLHQPLIEDDEDLSKPDFISGRQQPATATTTTTNDDEQLSALPDRHSSTGGNSDGANQDTILAEWSGAEDEWANGASEFDNNNESSSSSSFSGSPSSVPSFVGGQQQQRHRPSDQNLVISSKRDRPNNNNFNLGQQLEPDETGFSEGGSSTSYQGSSGGVFAMDKYFGSSLDSTKFKLAKFVHKIAPELSCYTGLGKHYRGNVSISSDKRVCLNWLHFRKSVSGSDYTANLKLDPHDDNHNYCRNPNLDPAGPWCFVLYDEQLDGAQASTARTSSYSQVNGQGSVPVGGDGFTAGIGINLVYGRKYIQKPCAVSPCSEFLWLYIVAPPLGLLVLLSCLITVSIRSARKSYYNSIMFTNGKRPGLPKFNKLLMPRGRFAPKKFANTVGSKKSSGNYLDDDVFEIVDEIDWSDGQTQSLSPKSTESLKLNSSFSSSSNESPASNNGRGQRDCSSGCKSVNPIFCENSLLDCNGTSPLPSSSKARTTDLLGGGSTSGNRSVMQVGPMFATLRCHIRGNNRQVHQAENAQVSQVSTNGNGNKKSSIFIEQQQKQQCDLGNTNYSAAGGVKHYDGDESNHTTIAMDWMASPLASESQFGSTNINTANNDNGNRGNKQQASTASGLNQSINNGHLISCSTTMEDIEPLVIDGSSSGIGVSDSSASSAVSGGGEKYVRGNELPQLNESSVAIAINQQPLYEGKFSQVQLAYTKQDSSKSSEISSLACIGTQVAVCSLKTNAAIDPSLFKPNNLRLHNLNHLNLIKLIGYAPNENEDEIGRDNNSARLKQATGNDKQSLTCSLIFDMAQLVDLSDWLKQQNRDTMTSNEPLGNDLGTRKNLTCFAKQIALAIDYLHDQGIIYKDLACRNCFLDPTKMLVKLASFNVEFVVNCQDEKAQSLKSMIRPKYLLDYYVIDSRPSDCQLLPLSWIPLESILFNKFNKQTDVWSFGCLLYELFSLGEVAYFGYSSKQVIDAVRSNLMPPQPLLCQNGIYKLLCKCLSDIPSIRPNVKQIYEQLNLYSGQCSSFLDHHLCSLATCMHDDQQQQHQHQQRQLLQLSSSPKSVSTMDRQNSITKTKSYANIRNFIPSATRGHDSSVRYDNLVRLPSDLTHSKPEVAKIPISKSINLGASRLVPYLGHVETRHQNQDTNHYDEPNVQIRNKSVADNKDNL